MRAAEAIRAAGAARAETLEIVHLDVMNFVPATFRKLYTDFYVKLVNRHPALWGYLYQFTNDAAPDSVSQRLRRAVEKLNTRELRSEIARQQADVMVCTHFLPAEMLSYATVENPLACPLWVQVTDFDLHRLWVQPGVTGYFAANEEVAYRMRACGVAAQRVHVTGIPIMPAFSQKLSRTHCAAELGVDAQRTTILLMGGGAGLGSLDSVAERLLALPGDFQLLVLTGKNTAALASLKALARRHPARLYPHGFTDRVERLMACADVVITKPGGLTSSECLAMGLPMIVNSPIPGQEERNADFLLEEGVALKAFDPVTLAYRVGHLLTHPDKLAAMRLRARALGRPNAASDVLDTVLGAAKP